MKTHYDLLALERTASADEVKRAFRREIARYHPDKVQHLGREFQDIAAIRAAELTEAYRVLMDVELRRGYDESLDGPASPAASPPPYQPPKPAPEAPTRSTPASAVSDAPAPPKDTQYRQERATSGEFVRRAVLSKFGDAVDAVGGEPATKAGFDGAYRIKGKRALFSKADPSVLLLLRVVPTVQPEAIQESWIHAARAVQADEAVCLMLLGNGLAPAKELSAAISEQRRRARQAGPVVIPVDMRDWEALFPPDTPSVVRTIVERLRSGR